MQISVTLKGIDNYFWAAIFETEKLNPCFIASSTKDV